jgi:2,3,4,5-tetrahydropyridine-2-carboxylate N-succinyltransferase
LIAMEDLQRRVEEAWEERGLLRSGTDHSDAVITVVGLLDRGEIRAAEPAPEGSDWVVRAWVQKAVVLFFSVAEMRVHELGPFEYHDKVPLKRGLEAAGVRVVPPGVARHGSFLERGVVLMPGYVNIGARVGARTMVDTWATVGTCAQIGADVHLSGGVGIGGVLEPPGARPVIVEDGAFIGSRSIVVEGMHIEREAVLGANTVLTASTKIIDVTGPEPVVHKGRVPARSVVIPGAIPKEFPAGTFHVPAALIIGQRRESTDRKTSLNAVLREFAVQV